jgi:hypothetical protein
MVVDEVTVAIVDDEIVEVIPAEDLVLGVTLTMLVCVTSTVEMTLTIVEVVTVTIDEDSAVDSVGRTPTTTRFPIVPDP